MHAWKAVYLITCPNGKTKKMEYFVAAPSAGDVPELIRDECNFDGATVDEVEISRMKKPTVIMGRHLQGEITCE